MANRHRALGRNRGAWAPNTLYLRGDVVTYLGALYEALNTFTSGATFNLSNWDLVLAAPAIPPTPTASQLGAAKSTAGPGLPPFTGRTAGDMHFDSAAVREYVLSGAAGAQLNDSFERTSLGTADSGQTYTTVGSGSLTPDGHHLPFSVGAFGGLFWNHGAGAALEVSVQCYLSNSFDQLTAQIGCAANTAGGWSLVVGTTTLSVVDPQGVVVLSQSGLAGLQNALVKWTLSINGKNWTLYKNDAAYASGATNSTGTLTGTYSGISSNTSASGSYYDNLSITLLGTLVWSSITQVTSQGAGVPSFAGRFANDLHYDTDSGKTFILTGVAGGPQVSDNFDGASGTLVGTQTTTGSKTWTDGGTGAALRRNGAGKATPVSGTGTGTFDVGASGAMMAEVTGLSNNAFLDISEGAVGVRSNGTGAATAGYWAYFSNPGGGNGTLMLDKNAIGSGGLASVAYSEPGYVSSLRIEVSGDAQPVIKVYLNGTLRITVTDTAASPPTGTHAALHLRRSLTAEAFSGLSSGTLAWLFNEPIYMQAQLASGAVATGTHVLKPGLRVPTFSTLREVVLRCDTAPVGAPITVQIERFNGGVSQGIIATASIAAGQTVGSVSGLNAGCAKGDMLKFNVTSVGSTTAGSDLTASLDFH